MAKLKIGDIVEVITKRGLVYAQYSHKHKQYGALLRIFDGFYEDRPKNFSEIIKKSLVFSCFFPLAAAVEKGIFSIVDNQLLSVNTQDFPLFRAGVVDLSTRKVAIWWLWDGEKEWKVGVLTDAQRKLSIRGVWNDTLLIERIESGWVPELDLA